MLSGDGQKSIFLFKLLVYFVINLFNIVFICIFLGLVYFLCSYCKLPFYFLYPLAILLCNFLLISLTFMLSLPKRVLFISLKINLSRFIKSLSWGMYWKLCLWINKILITIIYLLIIVIITFHLFTTLIYFIWFINLINIKFLLLNLKK